jgi:hypothetical protein
MGGWENVNMPEILFGKPDRVLNQIVKVLEDYEHENQDATSTLYRQNSVSVRMRIIDPSFEGLCKIERSDVVWRFLDRLPADIQSDITFLLLLAPSEVAESFANLDFERPVPSGL